MGLSHGSRAHLSFCSLCSVFFSGKPPPDFALVQSALPVLARLLSEVEDVEVLTDACLALTHLSDDTSEQQEQIGAMISSDVVPHLVKLIAHESEKIVSPAVTAIASLLSVTEAQAQTVLDAGVLPPLLELLEHPAHDIRRVACFAVSNLLAGSEPQIEEAISAGFIPPLVAILQNAGEQPHVRTEAAWALANCADGATEEQCHTLAALGAIPALCCMLQCGNPNVMSAVMEGQQRQSHTE